MLLVAAGEYPLSVAANLDQIEPYRLKGAPIKWVGLDPVIIRLRPLALAKNSSHPNAAKLFITFLLAPEGQKVTSDIGALPARPGFESDSLKGIKTHVSTMTAAQYQDNMKELREVFFKR
jgi:iron(III) transport system substrate-binding protein